MKNPIDNIALVLPYLVFDSDDDFYYLQILQRKKENNLLTANSHVIKNYYIKSVQHLKDLYPEIKTLCKVFNARASIRLNKRSFKQAAFQTLGKITNTILNEDYSSVKSSYDKTCGQFNNDKNKKWIIDIDDKGIDHDRIIAAIKFCEPNEGRDKHLGIIPSKSGYHIITKPFNTEQFKRTSRLDIDIHKDNPTNLYIP